MKQKKGTVQDILQNQYNQNLSNHLYTLSSDYDIIGLTQYIE
jgi:hypothetical protein